MYAHMSPTFGELAGFNMSRRTSLGGVCALLNLLPLPPPAVGVSPGGGVSLPPPAGGAGDAWV